MICKKVLRRCKTCVSFDNKLRAKLVLFVPNIFDDNLRVTSAAFFVATVDLFSRKCNKFAFRL